MNTSLKTCFKCRVGKPLSAFYKHGAMADGHLNKCIDCAKKDVAIHRLANVDHIRAYDRRRASMPHRLEKNRQVGAAWRAANPKRRQAQVALSNAVRDGRIERLPCFVCGESAEAHHPDYDAPLDVVWLCSPHHKQAHALARKCL